MEQLSKMRYDDNTGCAYLEFNKQLLVEYTARLYTWVMEAEESAILEGLARNNGKEALLRLRGAIDKALSVAAEVENGTGGTHLPTNKVSH